MVVSRGRRTEPLGLGTDPTGREPVPRHRGQGLGGLTGRAATPAEDGGNSQRCVYALSCRSRRQCPPCRPSRWGLYCAYVGQQRLRARARLAALIDGRSIATGESAGTGTRTFTRRARAVGCCAFREQTDDGVDRHPDAHAATPRGPVTDTHRRRQMLIQMPWNSCAVGSG
jgi:hypothetical protein